MNNQIKNYAEEVVVALKAISGDKYDYEIKPVEKSGRELIGILCRIKGSNVAPTVYADAGYAKDALPAVYAEEVYALIENAAKDAEDVKALTDDFGRFENVKGKVRVGLYPVNSYSESLVHRKVADLNECPYVEVKMGSESGKIAIKKEHLDAWGVTEDDVFNAASENHQDIIIKDMFGMMTVATNASGYEGASVILEPDFDAKAREIFPDGYVILPSSRHEVIIVDAVSPIDMLRQIVKEVNGSVVDASDYLSDSVYKIDETGDLVCVEEDAEQATA